jgi:hypothetical protein
LLKGLVLATASLAVAFGVAGWRRDANGQGQAGSPVTAAVGQTDASSDAKRAGMAAKLEALVKKNPTDEPANNHEKKPSSNSATHDVMPEAPEVFSDDPALKKGYSEALGEYYKYRVEGYRHRQRVFAWQLFSTKLIFAAVLLLVFLGMYFAALQFHAGLKFLRQGKPKEAGLKTELEISRDHGKVDSPVLGVIILLVSLAFFYLYLVFVYPVHDTF